MTTTGEKLIQLLEAYGIEIISGIPGTHTIELYRGLASSHMRHITPRHEQGAGFLADGYARVTGKPAACLTVSGPGAMNIATAMGQAMADSVPMLVISADNKTHHLGLGEGRLHEIPDLQTAMAQCSRWSHTLASADQLPGVVARAFAIFQSERPGPVHITVPLDIITSDASHISSEVQGLPLPAQPHQQSIEEAAERINNAINPVIATGGGAVDAALFIQELAERIGAPVTTTQNAKGILKADHGLHVGGCPAQEPIQKLYKDADLVIAIGTELAETDYDFFFKDDSQIPQNLVRIDIDPRQFSRNDVPAVSVLGDAKQAIASILPLLKDKSVAAGISRTKLVRKQLQSLNHPQYQRFFETLLNALPNLIVIGDSTQPAYYAAMQYDAPATRSFAAAASGYGTLGLAVPAAIGAKIAAPDRPVVALVGDGGLQFTINELSTAVEAESGIAIVLWNNHCYGEIAQNFRDAGMEPIACDIHTPDFIGIAKAYGCHAETVTNHEQLAKALIESQNRTIPSLIEVPEEHFI
ncbi:MAG: 5-guanidino-2-oxopentanoate decarboxylase [Acidiferrobacterales bacterium]|nr:5-guanidino-2-oxopentanoate decarboxylase [Acidiferrobacterales bacterium]